MQQTLNELFDKLKVFHLSSRPRPPSDQDHWLQETGDILKAVHAQYFAEVDAGKPKPDVKNVMSAVRAQFPRYPPWLVVCGTITIVGCCI